MATFQNTLHIIHLLAIINFVNGLQCPDPSQWKLRTKGICDRLRPWYYCLFDENTSKYKEFCRSKEDFHQPGYKYVVSGNINGKPCDLERFQPFKFRTEGNSRCVFKKSVCVDEGLIYFKNGTTISDRICRCDYTRGYAFVTSPTNICHCVPSEEDCSCYRKSCKEKEILTPGMLYYTTQTKHMC
ncbi:unnamed protein product [Mytilus coruscus]|uniref:Uncharacterized protein n=1 Tax=Mytilus coruscus TaxID=42192 RepID=A0A6J8B3U1_MYTCO|nr:unnamed protein product [Mytilus coruscus]